MASFEAKLSFSVISFSSVCSIEQEIKHGEKHHKISLTLMAQELQWPQTFHYYSKSSFIALLWASFLCVTLKLEIILVWWPSHLGCKHRKFTWTAVVIFIRSCQCDLNLIYNQQHDTEFRSHSAVFLLCLSESCFCWRRSCPDSHFLCS